MQPAKRLEYKPDPNKFDLRVHAWDAQGNLVAKNPYRTHITNGITYYERPVNSGNLFYENNQPAGRVEYEFGPTGNIAKKVFKLDDTHREYSAPLTGDAKLHYELEQLRTKNAAIEQELASIKAEKAPSPAANVTEAKSEATPTLGKKRPATVEAP